MSRLSAALSCFFSILFSGLLPENVARQFGYVKQPGTPAVPPVPESRATDGALQLLYILQRDARMVDFFMEDIASYSDEQVGAAIRNLHKEARETLHRHLELTPVLDGVEGTYQKLDTAAAPDPQRVKLLGNVPANGKAAGGLLRHRGWMAKAVTLPALTNQDWHILAPAEIEVE